MTPKVNQAGIACCGECGSELQIVCTGGCKDPDVVFKENYIASLPTPQGRETPGKQHARRPWARKPVLDQCTYRDCTEPPAPRGVTGRPPTRCVKHRDMSRLYRKPKKVAA